jgi:prophage regulatory protein
MVPILGKPVIMDRHFVKDSALAQQIRDGLFTPPVRIGAKKSAWPEHESDAILRARIAGCTDDQIRALVQRLVAERANLADRAAA